MRSTATTLIPNIVEFKLIAFLVLRIWRRNLVTCLSLFFCTVLLESVYDVFNLKEFQNRRKQLSPFQKSFMICAIAQIIANLYIICLESGRIVGHISRFHFKNIFRRFDWHCGMFPRGAYLFRRNELYKFMLFTLILQIYLLL